MKKDIGGMVRRFSNSAFGFSMATSQGGKCVPPFFGFCIRVAGSAGAEAAFIIATVAGNDWLDGGDASDDDEKE